jgi:copper chaperone
MKTEEVKIDGMSCGHCVMAVRKELSRLPLKIKDVSIGSAKIEYDEAKVSNDEIKRAVANAGYSVVSIN